MTWNPLYARTIPELSIPPYKKQLKVVLTEILTVSQFWFNIAGPHNSQAVEVLNQEMKKFYKLRFNDYRIQNVSEIAPGLPVAAVYPGLGSDELNRGLVKNVDILNKEATIFFCDFGSEINIQVSNLLYLGSEFSALEQQAVLGRIWGLDQEFGNDEGYNYLVKQAQKIKKHYSATIKGWIEPLPQPFPLPLVLVNNDTERTVSKQLVKRGLAKFCEEEQNETRAADNDVLSELIFEKLFIIDKVLPVLEELNGPEYDRLKRFFQNELDLTEQKLNEVLSRSTQEVKAGYLSHLSLRSGSLVPPIQDEESTHALKPPVLDSSFCLESPGHGNPRSMLNHKFEVLRPLNSQDLSEEVYNTGKQLTCETKIIPESAKEKKVGGKKMKAIPKNTEGKEKNNGCKLVEKTENDEHILKINQVEHSFCPEKYDNSSDTLKQEDRKSLRDQEIFYTNQDSESNIKDPELNLNDSNTDIKDSNSSIKDSNSIFKDSNTTIKDSKSNSNDFNIKDSDTNIKDSNTNIKDSKSNIKDSQSTNTRQNVLPDSLEEHVTAKIQVLPPCVIF